MDAVEWQANEIRDFINQPRTHRALRQDPARWSMLLSSLDVIGDTSLAIASFPKIAEDQDTGARYVAIYGTLQAMVVQQDAVSNLCRAFNQPTDSCTHERLKYIRDIRHRSVGHPTETERRGGGRSYNFISRITLGAQGFDLHSFDNQGRPAIVRVEMRELIRDQESILSKALRGLFNALQQKEKEHKDLFRGRKLVETFSAGLNYAFEKILQELGSPDRAIGLAGSLITEIRKSQVSLREALAERGITLDTYPGIEYTFEEIDYPLKQLESYFTGSKDSGAITEPRALLIFARYVREQIGDLRSMVEDIDKEYEGEG